MQRHDTADLAEAYGADGLGEAGTVTPTAGQAVPVSVHIRTPQEIVDGPIGTGGVAPVNSAEAWIPRAQLAGVEVRGARLAVPALNLSWEIVKPIEQEFGEVTRLQIRDRQAL